MLFLCSRWVDYVKYVHGVRLFQVGGVFGVTGRSAVSRVAWVRNQGLGSVSPRIQSSSVWADRPRRRIPVFWEHVHLVGVRAELTHFGGPGHN